MTKKNGSKRINKYEELNVEKLEQVILNMEELNRIAELSKSKCVYVTKTIKSGPITEIEIVPIFPKGKSPKEIVMKPTAEAQKNLNTKKAIKFFIRKLNNNFNEKDLWITLTYLNNLQPKDYKEAQKNIRNYFIKLNRLYKKRQQEQGVKKRKLKTIKYMYVIEKSEKGKWHYHIVMNSVLSMDEVESAWKYGRRNNVRFLYPDEKHLTNLGNYLTKNPKGKKRWGCSKNLKPPVITRSLSKFSNKKIIDMALDFEKLKAEIEKVNPGYKFIEASAKENQIVGRWYISGMMRKID